MDLTTSGEWLAVAIALIGALLIGVGFGAVFSNMLDRQDSDIGWGAVAIAIGVVLVVIAVLLLIAVSRR